MVGSVAERESPDATLRAATRIERIWRGEAGPGGAFLAAMLTPFEFAYRIVAGAYHGAYTKGLRRQHRLAVPVVSVGNIAVGGTGKTPVTRWVVEELRRRGARPAVLHGGYAADEPELHRAWYPDVPVVVERDRVAGGARAIAAGADVVVLDDGFQHRRLARDLDLVLVAAEDWTARTRLLPRGPWREPLAALRRADVVVVTRRTATAEAAAEVAAAIGRRVAGVEVAQVHLRPAGWLRSRGRAPLDPVGAPEGEALAVAAIARPRDFVANAVAAGAKVVDTVVYRDHHAYDEHDVRRIVDAASGRPIVTTAKDAVKLAPLVPELDFWILEQGVTIEAGAHVLERRLDALAR